MQAVHTTNVQARTDLEVSVCLHGITLKLALVGLLICPLTIMSLNSAAWHKDTLQQLACEDG